MGGHSALRSVAYVTGTRADFGLMESTLRIAADSPVLDVVICVTGMHLSPIHGATVSEIESSGLPIAARIRVDVESGTGAAMARSLGTALLGLTDVFVSLRPDIVMVLGDRGEMLAAALAAIHLNVPVVHVHGGELSGTVDEPVRHAISKLAHFHAVSLPSSRERLIRMGERPEHIFLTGAPGVDGLSEMATLSRSELARHAALESGRPIVLILYHPVLQDAAREGENIREIIRGVRQAGCQIVWLAPNADSGNPAIRMAMDEYRACPEVAIRVHMPRAEFVSWLAAADVMVGNSSSGIIESGTFGLPVVNVGDRQTGRETSGNVVHIISTQDAVADAVANALARGRYPRFNVYGDGQAGQRIVRLLEELPLDAAVLRKRNAY